MYNNELYHHGIKGQRWGVRRYQDEWGRLTPAAKLRKGTYIKRGTEFQRLTNLEEADKLSKKQIDNRIYVSRNPLDNEQYKDALNSLPSNTGTGMAVVKLTNKKDLRIVEHDQLFEDLVNTLGYNKVDALAKDTENENVKYFAETNSGKTISQALKDAESNRLYYQKKDKYGKELDTPLATPTMRDIKKQIVQDMFGSGAPRGIQKAFIKRYEKMGYDAIEDAEDINHGYITPLIVINPRKTLKFVSSEIIQTGEDYTKQLLDLT